MDTINNTPKHLLNGRQKLTTTISIDDDHPDIKNLLTDVDSALDRMASGAYGVCECCQGTVEEDRLAADPLITVCLECLTSDEQRHLEQDLELAARIQRRFLPQQNLRYNGWEAHYHFEPFGIVGGDYCDLIIPNPGQKDLYFLVGDVAGKGLAASMLMAHLNAIFRSLISVGLPLNQLLEQANRIFYESTATKNFATLAIGRATPSGEVEIANAGHCRPLIIRKGTVSSFDSTGLPLGVLDNEKYALNKIQLERDDSILLYTHGVIESTNEMEIEYGEERLFNLVSEFQSLSPKALTLACLENISAFLNNSPRSDDLTMMVIRRI